MQNIEEQAVSITLFGPRLNNKPRGLYFTKTLFEGLIFGGAYIRRGLSTEGNLRFKIDWASLIVGSKFTVFALFYFVFEGNFPSTSPQGAYIWRGDLTDGFLRCRFGGLIFGGAYTWRGLFSEFYGILTLKSAFVNMVMRIQVQIGETRRVCFYESALEY